MSNRDHAEYQPEFMVTSPLARGERMQILIDHVRSRRALKEECTRGDELATIVRQRSELVETGTQA